MLTIWKYPISLGSGQEIEMPKGAKVLTVQQQGSQGPQLWAVVDPELNRETRVFSVYGTGHPIDEDDGPLMYVGTFQMHGGALVWHLFETNTNEKGGYQHEDLLRKKNQ